MIVRDLIAHIESRTKRKLALLAGKTGLTKSLKVAIFLNFNTAADSTALLFVLEAQYDPYATLFIIHQPTS